MRLEDYAFVLVLNDEAFRMTTSKDNTDTPGKAAYYVALLGDVYGAVEFEDGKRIHTQPIKECVDGKAYTSSGSVYELGKKHEDYVAFENAENEGVPILRNWSFGKIKNGNHSEPYIHGNFGRDYRPFYNKVISQEGAIIICSNGTRLFVDWFAQNDKQRPYTDCGIKEKELKVSTFCGSVFQIDILNSTWTIGTLEEEITQQVAKQKGIC